MPQPDPVPIRISQTGVVSIEADQVAKVKKADRTQVTWIAQNGGGPWIIKFNKVGAVGPQSNHPVESGSPFPSDEYEVPRGGSITTEDGPVRGKVKKTYRYTVTEKLTGKVTHDPDIDVE
jgi:hypothetical protein